MDEPGWRGRLAAARYRAARFFARFNRWFARMTERYARGNERILSRPMRGLAVFAVLAVVTALLFMRLPTAFLPTEDQGNLMTVVQTPPGATMERTDEVVEPIAEWWMSQPETRDLIVVRGFSFFGRGQNNAMMFTKLKPWEERTDAESEASAVLERATASISRGWTMRLYSRSSRRRSVRWARPAGSR